jgi:phosphatidylglycerophosphate synthase
MIAILVCGFFDLFDGAVARKFNCTSAFGEMFDAATDAICYGFMMLILAIYGKLPWEPIAGITILGVINTVFRLVYAKRAGRTTNYRSYAMEKVVAYAVYLVGFGTVDFEPVFHSWMCFAVMGLVLLHDTKRMLVDPVPA